MRTSSSAVVVEKPSPLRLRASAARVRAYFEAQRSLRKGLCLLNAGAFDQAARELAAAARADGVATDLSAYLVQALYGAGRRAEAAKAAAKQQAARPDDVAAIVRLALAQWKSQCERKAVQTLRAGIVDHPESAELHFQLGTMLAALDENEEAELRFVQTLAIEKDHPHALAALGLSRAAQGDVAEALKHLRRAQRLRPADARIAFYLAQAATTATAAGIDVGLCIEMPPIECAEQAAAIDHLAATIEQEPEFVDAFLTLEPSEVDESVLGLLAQTLAKATERNPQHAALHYLQGRVLERLGRAQEAITAAERAVDIDPRHVQALILLAHLYRQTDRFADARRRLEETVMLGAEYADTYYLLGNLYRDDGQLQRARWAYEQALRLNRRYTAAQQALAALAA